MDAKARHHAPSRQRVKSVKSAPYLTEDHTTSRVSPESSSIKSSQPSPPKEFKYRSNRYKHIQSKIRSRSCVASKKVSVEDNVNDDDDISLDEKFSSLTTDTYQSSSHKRGNALFHKRNQADDNKILSTTMVREARKTGTLDLSGKGLAFVPNRVYHINEDDGNSEKTLDLLIANHESAWWNQVPLTELNLSKNMISTLSPNIKNLASIIILRLNNNALINLPKEICYLEKLTTVNLSHNTLVELPKEFFTLPNLNYLDLSHNAFSELQPDISDLHMLTYLDVCHNDLVGLPNGIGFLVRLTDLNLSYNHIKKLPPDFVNMRVLKKLDLRHNKLQEIPPDIGNLHKLQQLYLQHNKLIQLPDFDGCDELRELHLEYNSIIAIPKNLCSNLPHLVTLDLNSNKLTVLPSQLALLQSLVNLDLSNNDINNLPSSLSTLAHLLSLKIDGNPIRGIRRDVIQCGTTHILRTLRSRYETQGIEPLSASSSDTEMGADGLNSSPRRQPPAPADESIFPDKYKLRKTHCLVVTMQNLTDIPDNIFENARDENANIVDFSKNKLRKLPQGLLHMAKCATELIFAKNCLVELPSFIGLFERVTLINLACNQLKTLPNEFNILRTVRELNISNNLFEEIPSCVYEMANLEILQVRDNRITYIDASDSGLGKLKRLATLNLRNNNITSVPPNLGNLTNITSLDIIGNPFRQPRHQILEKGTDAIMQYLRNRIPV